MNIRQLSEDRERRELSGHAFLSCNSSGRIQPEPPCTLRTAFQDDRDRILHSKAFRRLKHKTQVFLAPEGDHYRTRLTHTLEVSLIARTVARTLALNEDLAEAIALGHDLGHTPFGHAGERILDELTPGGFSHVQQSQRVVDLLERDGAGLNLTAEVRDGIFKHSKGRSGLLGTATAHLAATLEGRIVRLADIIAYVNHDLDDAVRAGLVRPGDIPGDLVALLGPDHEQRVLRMMRDMIESSLAADGGEILLSEPVAEAIMALRDWLFLNVYRVTRVQVEFEKASRILRELFHYFMSHPDSLSRYGGRRRQEDSLAVAVADFLAGMTDRYAMNLYQRLFLPQPWKIL